LDGELHWYGPKSLEEKITRIRNPDEFEVGDFVLHPERGLGQVKMIDWSHCPDGIGSDGVVKPAKPLFVEFGHKDKDEDGATDAHWYGAEAVRNKIRFYKDPEQYAVVGARLRHVDGKRGRGAGTVVAIDQNCVVDGEARPLHIQFDADGSTHRYSWSSAHGKIRLANVVDDFDEDQRVEHATRGRGTVLQVDRTHTNTKGQPAPVEIEFDGDFVYLSEARAAATLEVLKKGEDKRMPHVTHRKGTEDDRRLTATQKIELREKKRRSIEEYHAKKAKRETQLMAKKRTEAEKEAKKLEQEEKKARKAKVKEKMVLIHAGKLKKKAHLRAIEELEQEKRRKLAELEKKMEEEESDVSMSAEEFTENSEEQSNATEVTDNSDAGSDDGTIMSQLTDTTEASEASSDEWDENWDGVLAVT
jgi:hypothetical protein